MRDEIIVRLLEQFFLLPEDWVVGYTNLEEAE